MKNEIVPEVRTLLSRRGRLLAEGWMATSLAPAVTGVLLALTLFPYDIGIMVAGIALTIVFALVGFIVLVVAIVATKYDAIKSGTGWAVGVVGFILLVAGVALYMVPVSTPSNQNQNNTGNAQAMAAYIVPSVDTTASLPASPYTACTSFTLQGVSGQTGVGVVWTTSNAVYSPDSSTSGHFLMKEAINTALATSASGWISATCFQMAFTFQYKQVPTVQGVLQKQPYMLKVDSIGYTSGVTNNQTSTGIAPVFAQAYSGSAAGDWMILIEDKNSAFHPACGEFSQQTSLGTGGCNWVTLGTNDGTAVDTVRFLVMINKVGPFGYDTTGSPVGKQDVINFEIGLPSGQVGSTPGYYLPSWTFQLQIQRNS